MNLLSRIRHNKDARTLFSNFIYLSLLRGASYLFPLIRLPYLARVIGPDKFGAIAFASSIIIIVETITDWGFNYTATRDVAVNRENIGKVSEIYSQVLYARVILMIISFFLLWAIIRMIPSFSENEKLILFTFLYIPGNIIFPQWLFQAFEKMRYITILSLVAKSIFTILVFVVIRKQEDYILEPILTACGFFVSGLIAQYVIYRNFKIRLVRPVFSSIFERLKHSTNMFICLLFPNLYSNFTTILLKSSCGDLATGIFNGGQRLQAIVDQLTSILSRTFFPFLARNKDKHHIYVLISGSIALCASALMFFGAKLFVHTFLTAEFQDAIKVMQIFSVSPIFFFLMNTYGTNYLVIIGKEQILRNIIVTVSLLGFGLTWWLTPTYSYIGAALTLTLVWGVRGIITYVVAAKEKRKARLTAVTDCLTADD